MNKFLLCITVFLLVVYILLPGYEIEEKKETVRLKLDDEIVNLELEEYIVGVVAAEMPATFSIEALKAQAVAARTYAMYKIGKNKDFDLEASINYQAYNTIQDMKNKWNDNYEIYYNKIKNAVYDTKNQVIKNNDKIICAYYFAMSNGFTEDSSTVFKENLEYIKSIESNYETELKNYEISTSLSTNFFCEKLELDCKSLEITDLKRSKTNHVDLICINNKCYDGITFRKILSLRSTDFDVKFSGNSIEIITRGYGHGVGMSQYGANEMAKKGYTYDEILKYYYNNVEILSI